MKDRKEKLVYLAPGVEQVLIEMEEFIAASKMLTDMDDNEIYDEDF